MHPLMERHKDAPLLKRLSRDLTGTYGKGFSHSNLVFMRKLYLTNSILQTASGKLSWCHYVELLKIVRKDNLRRAFTRSINRTIAPQVLSFSCSVAVLMVIC